MSGSLRGNSIFYVPVDTISPNPFQPRREFEPQALSDLAESIAEYGILQPPTVSPLDETDHLGRPLYELIAGERRLRASKLAGLTEIPVVIREGDNDKARLELAIIENLQREDLNPIERAKAFARLAEEFSLTHAEIGKQMGKSRVYVSNSLRLLSLPKDIQEALGEKKISEGHTRPLMMLEHKPDEQRVLFKEIMFKKLSVRESEKIARKIAHEKVRKAKHKQNPKIASLEKEFAESLGTRVSIEEGKVGGKIVIDYFSADDLEDLLEFVRQKTEAEGKKGQHALLKKFEEEQGLALGIASDVSTQIVASAPQIQERQIEDTDVDDTELDIVANPEQEIPEEYFEIFKM